MTREEAINYIDEYKPVIINEDYDIALRKAVIALELLDCLTDRPCSVCTHHKEKGCCKWNCVFDGYIK